MREQKGGRGGWREGWSRGGQRGARTQHAGRVRVRSGVVLHQDTMSRSGSARRAVRRERRGATSHMRCSRTVDRGRCRLRRRVLAG
jgi:hypothetical protein